MGEFNKDQGQTNQADQQGGKPAFGQFDREQGQQEQQDLGQKAEDLDDGSQQQGEQFEKTGQQPQGEDQNR